MDLSLRMFSSSRFKGKWRGRRRAARGLLRFRLRAATRRADDLQQHPQRIVISIDHAFLQRNDRIIRDMDALWTDFSAALGDVAIADAKLALEQRHAIGPIERMHLQAGDAHQKPRPT